MHAFTYQLYILKLNLEINFRFKILIYTSHVSKKNQILKYFSKLIYQFHAYETYGSDTTIRIFISGHACMFQKFYFLNIIVE